MKRSRLSVIAVLILGALPLACASKTPVEAVCSKLAECNVPTGKTEQQCIADLDATVAQFNMTPQCAELVTANEDAFVCAGDLSCEEATAFAADGEGTTRCKASIKAIPQATAQACFDAMQGQ
jgi:hypothetical protein